MKKYKAALVQIDKNKEYSVVEAMETVKKLNCTKFDGSVQIALRLNINPERSDQQLRGGVVLPHGIGIKKIILAITSTQEEKAKTAGADFVGGAELITKIKAQNWFAYDCIVATPEMMPELSKLGKILGPKGLMPNPKDNTLNADIAMAIQEIKKGKAPYRTDKDGNVHSILGKMSFTSQQLSENCMVFLEHIIKLRPSSVKGNYIKSIYIAPTMGPSIRIKINLEN